MRYDGTRQAPTTGYDCGTMVFEQRMMHPDRPTRARGHGKAPFMSAALAAPFDLTGRVALVTGAGSPTGIGFATARCSPPWEPP